MTDEELATADYTQLPKLLAEVRRLREENRRLSADLTAAQLQSESRGKALQAELERGRRLVDAVRTWEKRLRRMTISADGFPILQEMRAAIEGSK